LGRCKVIGLRLKGGWRRGDGEGLSEEKNGKGNLFSFKRTPSFLVTAEGD